MTDNEELEIDCSINGKHYIVQENTLPKAAWDLSLYEHRILSVVASKMKPEDPPGTIYYFKIQDFENYFDLTNAYEHLKTNLALLRSRTFTIKRPDQSARITGWIYAAEIVPNKGIVQVEIDPRIRPYFLEIQTTIGYHKYKLDNIQPFKSSAAFKIYMRLKAELMGRRSANIFFLIDEFREWMNYKVEYRKYNDLKRRVLEPALKDINAGDSTDEKKSDIQVVLEEVYTGRKIKGLLFKISLRQGAAENGVSENEATTNTIQIYLSEDGKYSPPDKETQDAIAYFIEKKITKELLIIAIEKYGIDKIKYIAEYTKENASKIRTFKTWAAKALHNGWGIAEKTGSTPIDKTKKAAAPPPIPINPNVDISESGTEKKTIDSDDDPINAYLRQLSGERVAELIKECKESLPEGTVKEKYFRVADALTTQPSLTIFREYIATHLLGQ